jgi:hypothetical protein
MKMTQTIDPGYFDQKVRRIRTQVSSVLKKWGLLPRFKRWRLAQDSSTGMIVLFGILNNTYIATHTIIPFSDYFDPRLLHDLANELQLQVVSCNTDGLRYAFILDRGQFGRLPTHIDYPFIADGKLLVRVVYDNHLQPASAPPVRSADLDDHALVRQGVGAFLKVFDDIKLRDDAAALRLSAQNQNLPDIVVIGEDEFKVRVAEHEADRQRRKRIQSLINSFSEKQRQ